MVSSTPLPGQSTNFSSHEFDSDPDTPVIRVRCGTREIRDLLSNDDTIQDDVPNPVNRGRRELADWRQNPDRYTNIKDNKYHLISDPLIPYTLSLYLQLIFNTIIIGFIVFILYLFMKTIKSDIKKRLDEMSFKMIKEMAVCAKEYELNNCDPQVRVPLAQIQCNIWESCMNQDPDSVGEIKITFEVFAEILNGFVKLLNWKTIFVLSIVTIGSLVVTNLTFDHYRYLRSKEMAQRR